MTTKTTEHLQLIKAECERLLAIADKRTQGEWTHDNMTDSTVVVKTEMEMIHFRQEADEQHSHDAAYIAACAGRAEAGWRSTIAAIDAITHFPNIFNPEKEEARKQILAAWPIELFTY